MKIGIISCCNSNVLSVFNALSYLDLDPVLLLDRRDTCDFLIMPGIGSFDTGIHLLRTSGFHEYILEHINRGKPFIGICLGMQLLFHSSDEGEVAGLSILEGHLETLSAGIGKNSRTPPNIGYNFVEFSRGESQNGISDDLNGYYYFIHSYALKTKPIRNCEFATSLFNGECFYSFFMRENICGIQFHPERSGTRGLLLISRIINLMKK